MEIRLKADFRGLDRGLTKLQREQLPFATAVALTRLAKGVERLADGLTTEVFENPTPFTQKAFATKPATKGRPVATVFPKDIQAAYLEPYIVGGNRAYGKKKGFAKPEKIRTNQYGNLTRGTIARLKANPNVFFGSITFKKSGRTVSGIWQRGATPRGERYRGGGEYGTRGNSQGKVHGIRTTLTLLVDWQDTTPVKKTLPLEQRARTYVGANAQREFKAALDKALATARPK